jgi:hypothetical protein
MKKLFSFIFKRFKKFKNKLKGKKRKLFFSLLLIWAVKAGQVKGAEGFPQPPPPGRVNKFQNECFKDPNDPRKNPDIKMTIRNYPVILQDQQVQDKYKHAYMFGVPGKRCRENFEFFKLKLVEHMFDPSTIIKEGTYKKTTEVIHFFNPDTSLNVMIKKEDNTFFSGWKLSKPQIKNVTERGAL